MILRPHLSTSWRLDSLIRIRAAKVSDYLTALCEAGRAVLEVLETVGAPDPSPPMLVSSRFDRFSSIEQSNRRRLLRINQQIE